MHNHKSKIIIISSCNNDNNYSKDILLFPFPPRVMIATVNIWNKTLDVEFFNNFEDNELTEGIIIPVLYIFLHLVSSGVDGCQGNKCSTQTFFGIQWLH